MKPEEIADEKKLLSRGELFWVIALVLPIFFFEGGPIWRHAFQIDAAVYWSYAPIPLLVLVFLLRRKAWSLGGFLASTTIALALKYMITTGIAFALWSAAGGPPAIEKPPLLPVVVASQTVAPKRSLDGVPRKTIEGRVADEDGKPVEGAWIYVEGDFGLSEESSTLPVEIRVEDHHFTPTLTVVRRSQPLIFRSGGDRGLHTVRGVSSDGSPAFHYPLVPGKAPAPVRVAYASGRIELSCAVHEKAKVEKKGAVIVLDHPFFTRSTAGGYFRMENIPEFASAPIAYDEHGNKLIISGR